ncbi:MAG: UdgX family uracil-DNA binding protein [Sphingomonadaceae bacterium]
MPRVVLAHPADLEGFRTALRQLVAQGIAPEAVEWTTAGTAGLPMEPLLDQGAGAPGKEGTDAPALRVPRRFAELAEKVICHRAPERFALLHRAALALRDNRALLEDRADPLSDRLEGLAKAVARDIHKMRAFLRFREVQDDAGAHFIAWFEPDHHILRHNSGFFIRRFANQRWTILTPEESAHWNGEALSFLPGASRGDAPAEDPLEAIWTTYYASIFNPARLKLAAMASEMPRKYWKNLPEAALIPELVAGAGERTQAMLAAGRAPTLARLREEAQTCTLCPLFRNATRTVFGEGPADARLMLVGEQPGDQEDLQGRPFVGPAGQLLDRALKEAGIDRTRAYVTNAVKHFRFVARGRRRIHQAPDASQIESCRWWLEQELELVRPLLVVMLGASAGRALLGRPVAVARERGRPLRLAGGQPALLTVHPSYLLRIEKADAAEAEYRRFVGDLAAAQAMTA